MLDIKRLAQDFDNDNSLGGATKNLTKSLLRCLEEKLGKSEKGTYEEWLKHFKFIYGDNDLNNSANKKFDVKSLYALYEIEGEGTDNYKILFCISTVYSILCKCITYEHVSCTLEEDYNLGNSISPLYRVLNGEYFRERKILNYCSVDFYTWFLFQNISEDLTSSLLCFTRKLYEYTLGNTETDDDFYFIDNLKRIYEKMFPRELRHALGEFNTPDWLAEKTTEQAFSYQSEISEYLRVLDPTCGSGTFLVSAINYLKKQKKFKPSSYSKIIGFDLNPLAVLSAKSNLLLSIFKENMSEEIVIPVFLFNILNEPKSTNDELFEVEFHDYKLKIHGGVFDPGYINFLIDYLINYVIENGVEVFFTGLKISVAESQVEFSDSFLKVKQQDTAITILNYLRDYSLAFLTPKADIILGNPPWINWEYLPAEIKDKSKQTWIDLGIFAAKGRDLSFSKEDISVLITYIAIDRHLSLGGILAFVIRQAVFKSKINGVGFRKFKIDYNKTQIKVLSVSDLSSFKSFGTVNAVAAVVYLKKGVPNEYPVPYIYWQKTSRKSIDTFAKYDEVSTQLSCQKLVAEPSDPKDNTSQWATGTTEFFAISRLFFGTNNYKARVGVFTGGGNAVYYLEILDKLANGNLLVSNVIKRAKRVTEKVTFEIEPDLIYPICKGSNIRTFKSNYDLYILCPHTAITKMRPIPPETMQKNYPKTFAYLYSKKTFLVERGGLAGWEKTGRDDEFYAIGRVGEYTFDKYKVAWKYIDTKFTSCVISSVEDKDLGKKLLFPNDKVIYIPTNNKAEAFYLCGILNSTPISKCIQSFMNPTSISTHVLEKVRIPTFNEENEKHNKISEISIRLQSKNLEIFDTEELDSAVIDLYKDDETETPGQSLLF